MQAKSALKSGMIGLEIHVYLVTEKKLFCNCVASREKGLKPNTNICPICTAQPGAKPLLPSKEAVTKATQIGLILGCSINEHLPWQRKHYSWPDLPKGYQNTLSGTHAVPLGVDGEFDKIGITEMHLEEDPASWNPETGEVDYNRSGLPLVEIVTDPDFKTAEEVVNWLKKLLHALSYLGAVDSDAGLKVDVNVNIPGKTERVEIKNINSFESIEHAVNYEFDRQMKEGTAPKHTRRFDEKTGKTEKMREKEGQDDYRFIQEPDLLPITLTGEFIKDIKNKLPELPEVKLAKFIKQHKIEAKTAVVLAQNYDIAEFFEKVIAAKVPIELAVPWVTVELLRVLNYHKASLKNADIKVEHFVALLNLVNEGKVTPLKAKEILNGFYPSSSMPKSEGKITDEKELEGFARQAMKANPKAVGDYQKGEQNALNFLMGEVMKITQKRADFVIAKKVLQKLLK
jgi:aspartyl-tRNA(Asn)/glutamyl-tRNA(Gln) amidotransferase subunit B